MNIDDQLRQKILVLDGATGTMIQRYKLSEEDFRGEMFENHPVNLLGCNDVLCLTRPEIMQEIHISYLEAGADIIETNSFNANRISMLDYGLEDKCYEINKAAAEVAKKAATEFIQMNKKPVWVAGSLGPTNRSASISPDIENPGLRNITFDELAEAYCEQATGLLAGGADILLVETVFDTLNCKAALYAIEEAFESQKKRVPVMVSVTISDASGRTLSGQTPEAFITSISHFDLLSVGLNCSLGPEQLKPFIRQLSQIANTFVSVHPNAGLPDEMGNYNQSAEDMGVFAKEYAEKGWINIMGGCCGTTPLHVEAIAGAVKNCSPREIPAKIGGTSLSGMENLLINEENNFINIGERTNVAGSRKFARLIREGNFYEAQSIARNQVEKGAQIIDVCMDDAMIDGIEAMKHFLNLIGSDPDIAKVPVMIDSSDWNVIVQGLKVVQGKCVVNSISLKEGEDEFIRKAKVLKRYGAAAVVMLFDENGQAVDYERRIEIASRSYEVLINQAGFYPGDIIFDPNVLAVATGIPEHNSYAADFIKAVKWIKENLPGAKISGGISNLSFSFRGNNLVREAMHAVFLYHAIQSGLDMAIINPGMRITYDDIEPELKNAVEDVILNRHEDSASKLIGIATRFQNSDVKDESIQQWRENNVVERIKYALLHGITDFANVDMKEALTHYAQAVEIIDGPLMEGMNEVGERFGAGKMFLPQVVKSARAMRLMVDIIRPEIEKQEMNAKSRSAGKILLATVKGDVHDIGKNILSVILSCNNFEIIDLGVMIPGENIIQAALDNKVDMIALSGLITPSLDEMTNIARMMQEAGMKIPLMVGGATTSELHTAVKIAPQYPNGVILHAKDASVAASIAWNALVSDEKETWLQQKKERSNKIQAEYKSESTSLIPFISAREAGFNIAEDYVPPIPNSLEMNGLEAEARDLIPFINWKAFYNAWKVKDNEALKLRDDALNFLKNQGGKYSVKGVCQIFPVKKNHERVTILDSDKKETNITLEFLRKQEKPALSLADFIAVENDHIGLFAVSAKCSYTTSDEFEQLLRDTLADRLVEAIAEVLHFICRKVWWGFSLERGIPEELKRGRYRGIRPAPGYPVWPDHSEKEKILNLLNAGKNVGIELTETYAMLPQSSLCGAIFSHPDSRYFVIDKIGDDQKTDYARRKQITVDELATLGIK
jgi:5-methyltetrahydrofolate--homocysteine methyltransferase